MDILETLASGGIIKKEDIPDIQALAKSTGLSIEQVLISRGVPAEEILKVKGESIGIPKRELGETVVPGKVLEYIPEESATHYKVVPLGVKDGVLEVGAVDPEDIEARDALTFISSRIGMPYKIFLISEDDFQKVLNMYKGLTGEVSKALTDLETEIASRKDPELEREKQRQKDATIVEDAPVTKIVAEVLEHAAQQNASDIHIEPQRENLRVRFRVDGVLNTSLVLPMKVHSAVIARVKILCNMRLDEKRKPQDGRFSATIEDRKIDFRVSTFPTYYGEKVVMRLLDQAKGVKKLDELGIQPRNLDMIKRAIEKPYGLILITGPTGSGKSTTLYSMLNEIDRDHANVLSLEDPVEYNMDGISQSQVHPEIDYTFATGLRTTLRQDPDIIMVGEIRDKETAQLAIQAALTGHLVLSTLHTNTAIGAIPRLVDMGIDPYLIAPTLILSMAQRLVRTLAPGSGKPMKMSDSIKLMIENQFKDLPAEYKKELPLGTEFYEPTPVPGSPNGLKGRLAVMEVFEMDEEIEQVILKNPTEPELWKVARKKGMTTMKEDAILKGYAKKIPFEEINTL